MNLKMRKRRYISIVLILLIISAALGLLVFSARPRLSVPVIRLVSNEPAGMFDDTGREMRLLTLTARNENPRQHRDPARDTLYVRDSARVVEVRMADSWIKIVWATNLWGLGVQLDPGEENPTALALVPAGSDRCRVWIQYGVPTLSAKGVLESAVARLPPAIRSRISYRFWRWIGFPGLYRPGRWRQISVELTLHPTSSPPEH